LEALSAIERHHLDAPLGELVLRFRKSLPAKGAKGQDARVFADAARMSAGKLSAVERAALDAWLDQVVKATDDVSWYTVSAAVKAAPERRDEVAAAAERFSDKDASGVLDFKRAVGLPVPADEADGEAVVADAEFPDFPKEEEPAPQGKL